MLNTQKNKNDTSWMERLNKLDGALSMALPILWLALQDIDNGEREDIANCQGVSAIYGAIELLEYAQQDAGQP